MQNLLFYSNTRVDKNIKYLIGADVHDDLIVFVINGLVIVISSALEICRLKKESTANIVLSIDEFFNVTCNSVAHVVCSFLSQHNLTDIAVPITFPIKLAKDLEKLNIKLIVSDFDILPQREIKSHYEISEIKKSIEVNKKCFELVYNILLQSVVVSGGCLYFKNNILTSEYLKSRLCILCLENGAVLDEPIVSCGNQSSQPHCSGSGEIKANEFIVVDLCPRMACSGYYSDVTRTFLKGSPSNEQQKIYDIVLNAQRKAISSLSNGIDGKIIYENVLKFFNVNGYATEVCGDDPCGMFHSLGHSFGLDIHEKPSLGKNHSTLISGNVVTVEPGLYYRGIGGVRIEDDILITDTGHDNLSMCIKKIFVVE